MYTHQNGGDHVVLHACIFIGYYFFFHNDSNIFSVRHHVWRNQFHFVPLQNATPQLRFVELGGNFIPHLAVVLLSLVMLLMLLTLLTLLTIKYLLSAIYGNNSGL